MCDTFMSFTWFDLSMPFAFLHSSGVVLSDPWALESVSEEPRFGDGPLLCG